MEQLLGAKLYKQSYGQNFVFEKTSDLLSAKITLVYFGAHWSPPCRLFTSELDQFYKQVLSDGGELNVVFVSDDGDANAYISNLAEMPHSWSALAYNEQGQELKMTMKKEYAVNQIPRLLVLRTSDAAMIEEDATDMIDNQFASRPYFTWLSQLNNELE